MPHALADGDSDDRDEPDALSDQLFELQPEDEYELDKVGEIVDDGECVPDPDCDIDCVLQGDAVYETDTVPHELAEVDGDVSDELDGLTDPVLTLDTDGLKDDDTVGDDDNVDEIVDEVDSVPDPDCDIDCVLQGDAVKETDTVPHELADDDGDDSDEPDGLTVPLLSVVTEGL